MLPVPGIVQALAMILLEGLTLSPGEGLTFVSFHYCALKVVLMDATILDVGLDAQSLNHWRGHPCCPWPSQSSP